MRVTRSLLSFLAVALVTAGCAAQPVAYGPAPNGYAPGAPRGFVQMAPNGYAPAARSGNAQVAPNGIDNTFYGSPAVAYTPRYAPTYASSNTANYAYAPSV